MRYLFIVVAVACLATLAGAVGVFYQRDADETQPAESKKELRNSIHMSFVLIPAGKFVMGSPKEEKHRNADETQHELSITRPFYLGVYEVTQTQYAKVMKQNPSFFSKNGGGKQRVEDVDTATHPVERISWLDAVEFCKKLSKDEGKTYRLPTEAEWEYACRAGAKTVFHTGNSFNSKLGNINGLIYSSYGEETAGPFWRCTSHVGAYQANAFGLFDMHGNVQEWCSDWYAPDYYQKSPMENPQGPASGTERVLRGGAWPSSAKACRCAARNHQPPEEKSYTSGFRVLLETD